MNNKLREMRLSRGISQRTMARAIGISASYYCQLEKGSRRMSLRIAQRLAVLLGVSLDVLFLSDNMAYRQVAGGSGDVERGAGEPG